MTPVVPPPKVMQLILHEGLGPVLAAGGFKYRKSDFCYLSGACGTDITHSFSVLINYWPSGWSKVASVVGFSCISINRLLVEAEVPGSTLKGLTYCTGIWNQFRNGGEYRIEHPDEIPAAIRGLTVDFRGEATRCFEEIRSMESLEAGLNCRIERYAGVLSVHRAAAGLAAAWLIDRARAAEVYEANRKFLLIAQENIMQPFENLWELLCRKSRQ